jgi:hypothetical protein
MEMEKWMLSGEAEQEARTFVDALSAHCPEMPGFQMGRLIGLTRVNLPQMTSAEAGILVDYLCVPGFEAADKVPTKQIPRMIAQEIRETFTVDFGNENLKREYKQFGSDPEWQAHFQQMPANRLADWVEKKLNPLEAYLLIVMSECYWERQQAHQDADLRDYFNISD